MIKIEDIYDNLICHSEVNSPEVSKAVDNYLEKLESSSLSKDEQIELDSLVNEMTAVTKTQTFVEGFQCAVDLLLQRAKKTY